MAPSWCQQGLTPSPMYTAPPHCHLVESFAVEALIRGDTIRREPWSCCRLATPVCESC